MFDLVRMMEKSAEKKVGIILARLFFRADVGAWAIVGEDEEAATLPEGRWVASADMPFEYVVSLASQLFQNVQLNRYRTSQNTEAKVEDTVQDQIEPSPPDMVTK